MTIRIPATVKYILADAFGSGNTAAKNFIIVTEEGSAAVSVAEKYGYPYGIE